MKYFIGFALLLTLAVSCRKDAEPAASTDPYLRAVLSHLRDSLSVKDFARIDSSRAYWTDAGGKGNRIFRLGIGGRPISTDFWLLRTDAAGSIQKGRLVHLEQTGADEDLFSGRILLSSLAGVPVLESTITNGYIDALHGKAGMGNRIVDGSDNIAENRGGIAEGGSRMVNGGRRIVDGGDKIVTLLPAPDADWLPEVIVVGYGSGGGTSSYISADGLLGVTSGGILAGGGQDGGGSSSGGGSSGGNDEGSSNASNPGPVTYVPQNPPPGPRTSPFAGGASTSPGLSFEPEYIYSIPAIDIRKFFNCFDQIPDAGASFSVQLCVDVPVNGSPTASSNASGLSAGHTFLVVSKAGSGMSITQSFGYYPASTLSIWDPSGTLNSVIKDNGTQEINGQLSMSLSAEQFATLKAKAIDLSLHPYSLASSNCTDYALGVVNAVRSSPMILQPYVLQQAGLTVNGVTSSAGFSLSITNSPQGLFQRLNEIKSGGGEDAANIQLDLSSNFRAPLSHGPCN